MIVKELITNLRFKLDQSGLNQYTRGIRQVKQEAQRAGSEISNVLDGSVGEAIIGLRAKLLGLFGGIATGFGLKSIIDTSAQFERFETILSVIEGSSAKAKDSMDWISNFAAKTPYDLAGVTDAFVKLKAYGIDPIANGMLESLGDTSAAMGKPLMQSVEAIADAMTGEFERLKEFGIKGGTKGKTATFEYTDAQGKQQEVSVDKTNRALIAKTLQAIWNEKYKGSMEKLAGTWEGLVSNLGDQWERLKLEIGKAGIFDGAKDVLKSIVDYLGRMDASQLKEIAETIVTILKLMGGGALVYLLTVWELKLHQISLKQRVIAMWQAIINRRSMIALGVFLKWAMIFYGLYLIGQDFFVWLQGGNSVLGELIGKSSEWADEIKWVKETFASIVGWLRDGGAKLVAWAAAGAAVLSVLFTIWRAVVFVWSIFKYIRIAMFAVAAAGGPITLVLALIAAAAYLIYTHWDEIKNTVIECWRGAQWQWSVFKEDLMAGIAKLMALWQDFKQRAIDIWNAAQSAWNAFKSSVISGIDLIKSNWSQLAALLANPIMGSVKMAYDGANGKGLLGSVLGGNRSSGGSTSNSVTNHFAPMTPAQQGATAARAASPFLNPRVEVRK